MNVANPVPITEFTKYMRKFSHLKEDGIGALQAQVEERFQLLTTLVNAYAEK